jgi:hypothetical protein
MGSAGQFDPAHQEQELTYRVDRGNCSDALIRQAPSIPFFPQYGTAGAFSQQGFDPPNP